MKARVKDQKVKETGKEANKAERLQKKGKGQKVGGRFVFSCEGLSKTLPDGRPLFTDLSFSLYERSKIGVLGPNGAGKSSLMKVIAGLDDDFDGRAHVHDGVKVGYLPQEPELDPTKDVRGNVLAGVQDKLDILEEYNEVCRKLEGEKEEDDDDDDSEDEDEEELLERKAELEAQVEQLGIKDLSWRIDRAMHALRCPEPTKQVHFLSGGERRRVALCRLLISEPDLLLLDEPTNHLDAESVAWLERFLSEYKGTVMAVTHDRYFLDNVAGWILEIDRGDCFVYEGNYSTWLTEHQKRIDLEQKKDVALSKQIDQELKWIQQTPKARQSKNKARVKAYEQLLEQARVKPFQPGTILIPPGPRLGRVVAEAERLRKQIEDRVLIDDFSFSLKPGAIVGVIGPNGAGKTTLLNILSGEDKDFEGDLKIGESVVPGYVTQHRQDLTEGNTIYEEISEGDDYIEISPNNTIHTRQYVAAFRFWNQQQEKTVDVLSGGERNRVHLAKLLKRGCNLLLMDEPTNDLDVHVLRNLEEAIEAFAGCAVVVTHDRWFLDRVCTDIIAFEGDGRVVYFEGSYGEYMDRREKLNGPTRHKFIKLK
ncbi:ABC transporter related, putative [Acanthamoeba castellanii str. Neff]|uniref:ABC transporter related, putative n=1 Tax=Acanthamoeba castellanii (strain ATCC 30010 / Neff) TaxID=1257118 RepID=L8HJL2_ACACF|nr:ABC transporter related, putative [Acanthamoeba castellanii str. Neff]ELR25395.1 ABC transporter related, putative [Acanthamoeba castellanii str. Neff]